MSYSYREYICLHHVKGALKRISPHVAKTPVLRCSTLDEIASKYSGSGNKIKLHFKCENLQKTGSFKARGACNAIILAKDKVDSGIVTYSSGNHGQAVAWVCSAQIADLPCIVIVPKSTSKVKCDAVRRYGAKLIFCENSPTSIYDTTNKIAKETGMHIVRSSDDYDVMAGQVNLGMNHISYIVTV